MTYQEACSVLGVSAGASKEQIKKAYRQVIVKVHPDVMIGQTGEEEVSDCSYSAQEVNEAYSFLLDYEESEESVPVAKRTGRKAAAGRQSNKDPEKEKKKAWNVPENKDAFAEREVYQYVEDCDCNIIGRFCIAEGRYLWYPDAEPFPLFLLSMHVLSDRLLDDVDQSLERQIEEVRKKKYQAELAYLLAQQYMDPDCLEELMKIDRVDEEGRTIYQVTAMLEWGADAAFSVRPEKGESLHPAAFRQHRLYVKNKAGEELGYLSFADDRLYYAVIPFLEQKRATVKILAADAEIKKHRKKDYLDLKLWIRVEPVQTTTIQNTLNEKIRSILEQYGANF